MKLILVAGDDSFEISDVKLKDGIIPCLSGISYTGKGGSAEMMEPAIWFKVHIMDILRIDCNTQVVQWSSIKPLVTEVCNSKETDKINSSTNLVRLNEDCVDFINGLDEVFDNVPNLLSSYRSERLNQADFYRTMIQLLHVNVLPNVKLSFENLPLVKQLIDEYNATLSKLDEEIISKTNMLLELKKTKQRERQKFAKILIESKKLPHFDDLLVQVLENDLKADLKKIDMDSEIFKESMLHQSLSMSNSIDPTEAININSALEKLSKIKSKSRLSWLYSSSSKGEEHQLQMMYVKMVETEGKIRSTITKLIDNKMMLRSVVETMKSVVDELKEGLDSFGVELNTKSFLDTSVIGESLSAKSWTSLPMHMFNIFSNASHHINREHLEGTLRVCAATKAILDEYNLHCLYESISPQAKNLSFSCLEPKWKPQSVYTKVQDVYLISDSKKSKSCSNITLINNELSELIKQDQTFHPLCSVPKTCPDGLSNLSHHISALPSDFVFVLNSSPDFILKAIEKLKYIISNHFNSICKKILDEINVSYVNISYNKVWLIYENYFYDRTIDGLLNVFRLEYSDRIKVLTKSIKTFSLEDLDLEDSLMTKLLFGPFVENLTDSLQPVPSCFGKLSFNKFIETSQDCLHHSSSDEDKFEDFDNGEFSKDICSSNNSKNTLTSRDNTFLKNKDNESYHIDSLLSYTTEASLVHLKQCVVNRFSKSYQNIFDALKAKTPKTKAHHLLRCLRNMTWQIESIYKEIWKKRMQLCSDDVMDALIILLCNLHDPQALEDLYIQVQFLIQVLAQFFCNGEYHFALVQFVGVFQYLHDKAFMKKNRVTTNNRS